MASKAAFYKVIDNTALESVFRTDGGTLRAHLDGFRYARKTRQALRSTRPRHYPELYFRLANLSTRQCNPVMAGHRQLKTSAKRRAVKRRHHRLAEIFHAHQQRLQAFTTNNFAGRAFTRLLDISPSDKRAAGANKDHSLDGPILLDLRDGGGDAGGHCGTQRVHRRIIDGDDRDTVSLCELNQFAHDSLLIDFL
jgi:hypothetical protein